MPTKVTENQNYLRPKLKIVLVTCYKSSKSTYILTEYLLGDGSRDELRGDPGHGRHPRHCHAPSAGRGRDQVLRAVDGDDSLKIFLKVKIFFKVKIFSKLKIF